MGDCYTPGQIQNFVSKDIQRIVGEIVEATARRSPFIDALKPGVIDNQMGSSYRAVIQEPTAVAASLVVPAFTAEASVCRNLGGTDNTGTREYLFSIGVLR